MPDNEQIAGYLSPPGGAPARPEAASPMLGGQAVIEGVMMRAPGVVATAVRRPDGTIVVRRERHRPLTARWPVLKAPVLRGAVGLVDMLAVGIRTLNFSASVAQEDPAAGGRRPAGGGQGWRDGVTVAVSLALAVALFFALPLAVATLLVDAEQQALPFNLAAGAVRVLLLVGYLALISRSREIRRVFEYHGAEHKAVAAAESGGTLTVDAAARQSRFHPRCGTSFLLVVMVSAILFFSLLDALLIALAGELTLVMRLATHLPLIPLVAGVSYEVIRFSARHAASLPGRMAVAPGLWLQRLTTREPDSAQLEVAVAALRHALGTEGEADAGTAPVLLMEHAAA